MSVSVLPAMPILAWPAIRSPIWKTRVQTSVSGKEVRIADWSYPRYKWQLAFNGLRQGGIGASTEFQQMLAFFNTLQGGWDSFLYTDVDDNNVANQLIGTGAGVVTTFQLVKLFGGYAEPVTAPNLIGGGTNFILKVAGVTKVYGTDYTVSDWSSSTPGVVTFTAAPTGAITVTFNYYYPCRFDDDTIDFSKFLSYVYELKKLSFTSIK